MEVQDHIPLPSDQDLRQPEGDSEGVGPALQQLERFQAKGSRSDPPLLAFWKLICLEETGKLLTLKPEGTHLLL